MGLGLRIHEAGGGLVKNSTLKDLRVNASRAISDKMISLMVQGPK